MYKNFTLADKLFFASSLISLIYAEVLFYNGDTIAGIFVSIWVPSILCFGIYLKLLKGNK